VPEALRDFTVTSRKHSSASESLRLALVAVPGASWEDLPQGGFRTRTTGVQWRRGQLIATLAGEFRSQMLTPNLAYEHNATRRTTAEPATLIGRSRIGGRTFHLRWPDRRRDETVILYANTSYLGFVSIEGPSLVQPDKCGVTTRWPMKTKIFRTFSTTTNRRFRRQMRCSVPSSPVRVVTGSVG
jgi:hypothetical protein